jgi:murein DD-endopeptidase MepM/ murein hydrolase activator NlpD
VTARRLGIFLLVAAFPLLLWAVLPVGSNGASPSARLDQLQRKIRAKEGQIGRKKGTERVLTTQVAAYTAQIVGLQRRVNGLQQRQSAVQGDLDASMARLEATQKQLRAERARLVRLRARLTVVRGGLATRLRELYTADQPDIVTVILDARGFADLLERGEFLRRVSDQDQAIFRSERRLDALRTSQLALTERIQSRRDEIAALKDDVQASQAGVARVRASKRAALLSVRDQRHHLEDELGGLRAQSNKIAAELRAAQARAAGLLPAGTIRQGSGGLIWPVNGPITSPFCEARAWESCHPGIDIGVPGGTPIRAAAAGRVALMQGVAVSGGYGNFTCIQHTSVMSTCYAHQSRFATSVGAHVSQGQVIGYVGCTGRCFGDHLHFEVRINGSVVNPMGYL